MGVYYSLAYGIALTDDFGGQLKDVDDALMEFADQEYDARNEESFLQSMPTVESPMYVLGVDVPEGPEKGLTFQAGGNALEQVHQRYLAALAQTPEHVQQLISSAGLIPRLCVLAGDF